MTEPEGSGSAVLLRALEPVEHVDGRTQGPALLSKAMHIDRSLTGHDLPATPSCRAGEAAGARLLAAPATGRALAVLKSLFASSNSKLGRRPDRFFVWQRLNILKIALFAAAYAFLST